MANVNEYVRFDWAIKRILRDKVNAAVLEGLMTVLIGQKNHHYGHLEELKQSR